MKNSVEIAQEVLRVESHALRVLSENIPDDFENLVIRMASCQGSVIVSGVGKSGHIGRKISATLASTGTKSYFIHATEASHGDLGMIGKDDLCLLISNSGETTELRDVVAHTRRFNIPMGAISSQPDSFLMRAADYRLCLPDSPEACPIGMAPTTSTTLTLALGDALAIALMSYQNFCAENFKVFHPGGKLGDRMATVGMLMHDVSSLPLVKSSSSMFDTIIAMTSKGFGIAAVVSDNSLVGVVTDGDLRRNMTDLMEKTAGDVASKDPITVLKGELVVEALGVMDQNKVSALIVVDSELVPVGIIHVHDLMRAGLL